MIRSYNDHAANERTFLAWVRTGLSTVALGIVIKKGSLIAALIAGASSPALSGSTPGFLSDYGGPALVGIGLATLAGAGVRFVRTALRIDDQEIHTAGIVRLASSLLRRSEGSGAVARVSTNASAAVGRERDRLLRGVGRINLRLAGGTDVSALPHSDT
jgi:putative membrane protein